MVDPEGTLTAAQHEILEVVWDSPRSGATITEIWHAVHRHRPITRTTVLNQVNRLERRGWLVRRKTKGGLRYLATMTRKQASQGLAREFVDSFFGGSATGLLVSLLGSKKLSADDAQRLRELLDAQASRSKSKE